MHYLLGIAQHKRAEHCKTLISRRMKFHSSMNFPFFKASRTNTSISNNTAIKPREVAFLKQVVIKLIFNILSKNKPQQVSNSTTLQHNLKDKDIDWLLF